MQAKKIELTEGASVQLAAQIEMVKAIIIDIDLAYLKEATQHWKNKASMYDSAAVLISNYSAAESDLNKAQHRQLQALVDYIEACQEVTAHKRAAEEYSATQEHIDKLFKLR